MVKQTRIIAIFLLMLMIGFARPSRSAAEQRILIGPYDPAHVNGVTLIGGDRNYFGLRFLVYRQGAEAEEVFSRFRFGPHAADGSYAEITWQTTFDDKTPVRLRWGRAGRPLRQMSASRWKFIIHLQSRRARSSGFRFKRPRIGAPYSERGFTV
jgi:hypothetical protein